jgi:hypothetical protein
MRLPLLRIAMVALLLPIAPALARAQGAAPAPARPAPQLPRFEHGPHRNVPCANCHNSQRRHGEIMVRTREDCMRCHHGGAQRQNCTSCHPLSGMRRLPVRPRSFVLAASHSAVDIAIRFDHAPHTALGCATCHGAAPSNAPDQTNCATCHELHHGPDATCTACHAGTGVKAKHTRADHASCTSASCHGQAAAGLPNTREACLVCHTSQRSHMGDRLCTTCHPVRGTP